MKLELRGQFYLELLLCLSLSGMTFTEHNELTQGARRLVSFEFPRDLNPSLEDLCFLIEGFWTHENGGKKAAQTFVKAFARKDPDRFQELLNDQSKPHHFRKYRMKKGIDSLVLSTAALYGLEPKQEFKI